MCADATKPANAMSENLTLSAEYCSDLVRRPDEDRWLAAQYASGEQRRALLALYAFQCELRQIPTSVSEPALGEIRLQWWREAIERVRGGKGLNGHPVMEEFAACGLGALEYKEPLEVAITAVSRSLYGEDFTNLDDLAGWLEQTDGAIDLIATRLCGGKEEHGALASKAGAAFAMAREGAGLAPSCKSELQEKTLSLWEEVRADLQKIDAGLAPAFLHLALTPNYLKRSDKPFPLQKRVRMFFAMAFGRF